MQCASALNGGDGRAGGILVALLLSAAFADSAAMSRWVGIVLGRFFVFVLIFGAKSKHLEFDLSKIGRRRRAAGAAAGLVLATRSLHVGSSLLESFVSRRDGRRDAESL